MKKQLKLKSKTKESIANISVVLFIIALAGSLWQGWMTTESVHVFASENGETSATALAEVTPSPTPTATPEPDPEIKELIYRIFGEKDGPVAYAIARAESGLNPNVENCTAIECSIGLFQINLAKDAGKGGWVHWDKVPGDNLEEKKDWLKEPANNILIAKFLKGSSGWYPWSVFKNGAYKKFL